MNSDQNYNPLAGGRQGSIIFPGVRNPSGLWKEAGNTPDGFILREPARKIPPKRMSIAGAVPFQSLGRMVKFESALESNLLDLLATYQPRVGVLEQPVRLDRRALGFGKGVYTPDFLVWRRDDFGCPKEAVLVEVKTEEQLIKDWEKVHPRLLAGRRFAKWQGWRFSLVTERHLRELTPIPAAWPSLNFERTRLVTPDALYRHLFKELPR